MTKRRILAVLAPVLLSTSAPALAQSSEPLEIGDTAPDFMLPGATRYGVLAEPVSLSDFAGKTIVLAFFFKARSRG